MTKHISRNCTNDIVSLLKQHKSAADIARIKKVSVQTVYNIKRSSKLNFEQNKPGPLPKVSKPLASKIAHRVKTGTFKNSADIVPYLKKKQVDVSPQTIRRVLKGSSLEARHKPKVLPLTKKRREMRLQWAKDHQSWTIADWKKVVFSDETKINRIGSDGAQWVWKEKGSDFLPCQVQHLYKHGGGSLMLWGCFMWEGPGFIAKIDGGLDSNLYVDILQDDYLNSLKYYSRSLKNSIFQQDNDPKHTSKLTQTWLQNNKVTVLTWPSFSPDLNPIENLWAILKRRLAAYESPPTSVSNLFERVSEEWNKIDQNLCKSLIESMPDRIQAVIKSKGGQTKY